MISSSQSEINNLCSSVHDNAVTWSMAQDQQCNSNTPHAVVNKCKHLRGVWRWTESYWLLVTKHDYDNSVINLLNYLPEAHTFKFQRLSKDRILQNKNLKPNLTRRLKTFFSNFCGYFPNFHLSSRKNNA